MLDLIATSTFGLEAVVARELTALGYQSRTIQPGRMLFQGGESAICRANLWLRAADRVLLRLGVFQATDFGTLFDQTYAVPWDEWIPPDAEFPVTGRSHKSQLSSVPACQKIVKKAVVEKLKAAHHVSTLPETGPRRVIEVALLEDQATLTLDTTGPGLHKRGYRPLVGQAPLKETLAAAMVLLSFWRPERPLIDPFCGTGTIPIEAALIGRNLAPGLHRGFAAESWPRLPQLSWQRAREEARELARPDIPGTILGSDVDEESLRLARQNAAKAGVARDIRFQRKAFAELSSDEQYGCVICNPPYGERLGERDEIEGLYRSMPEVLRRLKTWSHYILAAHPDFQALVGQSADRRRKLFNGRIPCTLYQFHGPRPGAPLEEEPADEPPAKDDSTRTAAGDAAGPPAEGDGTAAAQAKLAKPAFGGLTAKARHQAELLRVRLAKRVRHFRRWPTKMGITCYRLYDRDIPEIPLAVDRYEDCLHIAEYARPHEHTAAEHADWLDLMARTAGEVLGVPPANLFTKRRRRQRPDTQYRRLARQERILEVTEGGLKFRVNLSDHLDPGLFPDHRVPRPMVRSLAQGKRFLNLFAYTGAFSVYAAAGGAESTTSVDLSSTYLQWAQHNMTLNGFSGDAYHVIRADAMSFLKHRPRLGAYDLAVVDPPTFSNSKRLERFWDIQRDHVELLNRLLPWMTPGGVIFFSTNFRRFKLAAEELAGATIREISRQTVPPDFRNRRIHRCWRMVRTGGP